MGLKVTGKDKLPVIGEYSAGLIKEKLLGETIEKLNDIQMKPREGLLCYVPDVPTELHIMY